MRGATKGVSHEGEEESAFVSMTDMTVSFLFIVMILLAFFASQIRDPHQVPKSEFDRVMAERDAAQAAVRERDKTILDLSDQLKNLEGKNAALTARVAELEEELRKLRERPLEAYLNQVSEQRKRLLETLQNKLKVDFPELQVVVSQESDALRFKGDGLFDPGSDKIKDDKIGTVRKIAGRLNELLPCFTLGKSSKWSPLCNEFGAVVEAVQIEGHTDANGAEDYNLRLSTNRADETLVAMTKDEPHLLDYLNSREQPVISVAGYGKMRPVADNKSAEGRATNRRIDLRLIMYTPNNLEEIAKIKERLRDGVAGTASP